MIVSIIPFASEEFIEQLSSITGEKVKSFRNIIDAVEALPEAEILIHFGNISGETLKICRNLKWLFSLSAGVEKLPFPELIEMGITVTNTRGIHGKQMAEHVIGIMIAFSRYLHKCLKNQIEKKWDQNLRVDELAGRNLCIIGAGSIGMEIARKAKAFDMIVTGLKKHPVELEYFDFVWGIEKLHEALNHSDYSVLVTPLTDETFHLMGLDEFKAMKKNSVFINISRGDTVDENVMIEALKNGIIRGAGLDVFHEEPLPQESPLWNMENVIITPHNAGVSPYYMKRALEIFLNSLKLYKEGKPLPNRINLIRKY